MKNLILILVLFGCKSSPWGPHPEPKPDPIPDPCEETLYSSGLPEDVLIGGRPANPAHWPASVYISSGGSRCSATVVGKWVVLTAAHCVNDGGRIQFNLGPNRFSGSCKHHPNYKRNKTADFALCKMSKPMMGLPYESIATKQPYAIGDTLLLTGYGCTRGGGGGGNDGIFRIGEAKVTRAPKGGNYDTVLEKGAALCFGDSGGAGFVIKGDKRLVFGVNSRGDIATTSFLSSTWFGDSWMGDWANNNKVKICGLHPDASGCRNSIDICK
jgi:hypothetical protein